MKPFLQEVAEIIYRQYFNQLNKLQLVFPNKRAKIYFDKYFKQMVEQPVWSPQYFTINQFIRQLSPYQLIDNTYQLIELYKVYKTLSNSTESFDTFYFWGETLLADFNDIDKYMVNAADVFTNLSELKELNDKFEYLSEDQRKLINRFWRTFKTGNLSGNQHDFIAIWKVLMGIYNRFRKHLQDEGLAYEGMMYRELAERIKKAEFIPAPHKITVFIGFNALNKCEHELFTCCQVNKQALFFWDYDAFYMDIPYHEAAVFMKENIRRYPQQYATTINNLVPKNKNIKIIQAGSETEQTKLIPEVLTPIIDATPNLEKTAIILGNEELLIPVLYALPQCVENVNITMGYPVASSQIISYFIHVLNLQAYCAGKKGQLNAVNHAFILPVISHQYYAFAEDTTAFKADITKHNYAFVPFSAINKLKVLPQIIAASNSVSAITNVLLQVLTDTVLAGRKQLSNIETEQFYHLHTHITRLGELMEQSGIEIKPATYVSLLKKSIKKVVIPFYGEPLAGLQLMGILETRGIDFENLVLLSMNEGRMPKPANQISFIPHSLRRGFTLPTIEQHDALYAYYFYRLLQRATNIIISYNADPANPNSEMSRYLYQIKYHPGFNEQYIKSGYQVQAANNNAIQIHKSNEIMMALYDYTGKNAQKYLSPSALTTYIHCPLKFYFRYVLHIREEDELLTEIDAAGFGNILHKATELIYANYLGKEVDKKELQHISANRKTLQKALDKAIAIEFLKSKDTSQLTGNNIIIANVLFKYLQQLFVIDKRYAPVYIAALENQYNTWVVINNNTYVKLGGKIDRIDRLGSTTRIIDYKTGSVKNKFSNIASLFTDRSHNFPAPVFQTFLYCKLYADNTSEQNITPGLYFTRNFFKPDFDYHIFQQGEKRNTSHQVLNYYHYKSTFNEHLQLLLEEIYNTEIPFVQTNDEETCKYCEFNKICGRN